MNLSKVHSSQCGDELPEEELTSHAQSENSEIIEYTIKMIRASNPDWVEENGACQKCWDHYKNL